MIRGLQAGVRSARRRCIIGSCCLVALLPLAKADEPKNLVEIDATLATSGQPDRKELQRLKRRFPYDRPSGETDELDATGQTDPAAARSH